MIGNNLQVVLELARSRGLLSILGIGLSPSQSASRVVAAVDIVVIEKRVGVVARAGGRGSVDLGSSRLLLGAGSGRRRGNDSGRSSRLGLGLLGAGANRNKDHGRRSSLRSRGRGNDDNAAGRRLRSGSGSLAGRRDRGRGRFLRARGSIHGAAGSVLVESVRGNKRHISRGDSDGNPLLNNLGGDVEASVLENRAG